MKNAAAVAEEEKRSVKDVLIFTRMVMLFSLKLRTVLLTNIVNQQVIQSPSLHQNLKGTKQQFISSAKAI